MDPFLQVSFPPQLLDTWSLTYLSSCPEEDLSWNLREVVEQRRTNDSRKPDRQTTNKLRDYVDGVDFLQKTNNRAEFKLQNLFLACPSLLTTEVKIFTLGEALSQLPPRDWLVVDMAAGPGAWSLEVLRRSSDVEVYGFTKRDLKGHFNWYPHLEVHERFHGTYGDIFDDSQAWLSTLPRPCQLYLADGGLQFESFNNDTPYDPRLHSEMVAHMQNQLFLQELIVGLQALGEGGHLVVKVLRAGQVVVRDMIVALTSAFAKVTIVKLISSRSSSSECYLVALARKSNVQSLLALYRRLAEELAKAHETAVHWQWLAATTSIDLARTELEQLLEQQRVEREQSLTLCDELTQLALRDYPRQEISQAVKTLLRKLPDEEEDLSRRLKAHRQRGLMLGQILGLIPTQ